MTNQNTEVGTEAEAGADACFPVTASGQPRSRPARYGALVVLGLTLLTVSAVRWRVADIPLMRDEGEYAYAGQLILQGVPPYQLAYNMKLPGTYYAYAAMLALFGESASGIHLGLLLVNAATILLLFYLGRRLLGDFAAAVGATTFALLSLDRGVMGIFAHATHFALLPALAGLLVLLRALDSQRTISFLSAGMLTGLAILMKQQAFFFAPFLIGVAMWSGSRREAHSIRTLALQISVLIGGLAVPFAVLCGVLAVQGVLGRLWFWTFVYAKEYVSEVPLSAAGGELAKAWTKMTHATLPIWILAAVGFAALWIVRWTMEARLFLTGLLITSFLTVCPGFYFRPHYFIPLLPAVGLLVGVAIASIDGLLRSVCAPHVARMLAVIVFIALLSMYAVEQRQDLFSMSPKELSRSLFGPNPFIEAVDIASYIQKRTAPEDRIAVLGSEPEIYFLANRKSATGYIYTYSLMEPQPYASHMQDEMIREIEAAHPKYFVTVQVGPSWLVRPESNQKILSWMNRYTTTCYSRVGVAEIDPAENTTWRWDDDAVGYTPHSKSVVYVFRRKTDAPCIAG